MPAMPSQRCYVSPSSTKVQSGGQSSGKPKPRLIPCEIAATGSLNDSMYFRSSITPRVTVSVTRRNHWMRSRAFRSYTAGGVRLSRSDTDACAMVISSPSAIQARLIAAASLGAGRDANAIASVAAAMASPYEETSRSVHSACRPTWSRVLMRPDMALEHASRRARSRSPRRVKATVASTAPAVTTPEIPPATNSGHNVSHQDPLDWSMTTGSDCTTGEVRTATVS